MAFVDLLFVAIYGLTTDCVTNNLAIWELGQFMVGYLLFGNFGQPKLVGKRLI